MSLVKWVRNRDLRDDPCTFAGPDYDGVAVIPLTTLTEVVEGLQVNIAHSFINSDEISAYRLACEHILTQLEAHRKEGA